MSQAPNREALSPKRFGVEGRAKPYKPNLKPLNLTPELQNNAVWLGVPVSESALRVLFLKASIVKATGPYNKDPAI